MVPLLSVLFCLRMVAEVDLEVEVQEVAEGAEAVTGVAVQAEQDPMEEAEVQAEGPQVTGVSAKVEVMGANMEEVEVQEGYPTVVLKAEAENQVPIQGDPAITMEVEEEDIVRRGPHQHPARAEMVEKATIQIH